MNKTQEKEVIQCLVDFVKRVANDENASPEEITALPEIARLLFDTISLNAT